jgi:HPt (histidine-containing phosphotransfer) domain-containing protein
MSALDMKPIYSSHSDDPTVGEAVDRFVIGLAECIDQLQDAEVDGDLCGLASLAAGLRAEADAAGYAALAGVSEALEVACIDENSEAAREKLIELTEIAQRVRLGHKGAA